MAQKIDFPFEIIAVDMDGTMCQDAFPDIGAPCKAVIDRLIAHKEKGGKLILWTCRNEEDTKKAVEWAKEQGVEFDAVNDDIKEVKDTDFGKNKSRKVYANIYLDDKNELIKESVDSVEQFLKLLN